MKVFPFKIPKSSEEAFIYQEDCETIFYDKYHQHEEIQISYIKKGEGKILVGDMITEYQKGDIIILGSNLPHVFKSDISESRGMSVMLTVFFTENGFGKDFFNLPELNIVEPFFTAIKNGIQIRDAKPSIIRKFKKFKEADKYDRFILLMSMLKAFSQSDKKHLSNYVFNKPFTDAEGKRMQMVFDFVMTHYQKNITLDEIAQIANMTKNAFCKYFKTRTKKTFFQFLIEIRIEHAAKLLIKNKELSIIEISELSGFNNISNFNRKFKEIKKKTPFEFKNSLIKS
ncbi:AraC family transcriptional regulator [Flavobacterium ginsenosidimutans]|uniref:AraC family transcriptional regulator n=1 Tax=Flavobacterium ginsenosidimutans TaxID=687844 RepID=A0ABZ2QGY7_9FLAO|nr:AraC family transcriptional regulator [Flavobacterium ginsenosidimutans]KAF2330510.1 helix-turn-helix transcriptional regulator [Flavobacterium ginsenosidimutans]